MGTVGCIRRSKARGLASAVSGCGKLLQGWVGTRATQKPPGDPAVTARTDLPEGGGCRSMQRVCPR